jgi:hypothetical protein
MDHETFVKAQGAMHPTSFEPKEPAEVRLDEFMAAFEIAGCFRVTKVTVQADDLEAIPYGGTSGE